MLMNSHVPGADPWFAAWEERVGLPDDHVALELATSGTNRQGDLIVAADLVIHQCGKQDQHWQRTLNWTDESSLDQDLLRQRLDDTAAHLCWLGRSFPYSWETLAGAETDGRAGLALLLDLLDNLEPKTFLVGHGLWCFILPFLTAQAEKWL